MLDCYLIMVKIFFGIFYFLFNVFGVEVEEVGKGCVVMSFFCCLVFCD